MYDIQPLEDEWNKYRKKKRLPFYLAGSLFILFFGVVIFFTNYKSILPLKDNKIHKKIIQNKKILLDKALNKLEVKKVADTTEDMNNNPMEASDVLVEPQEHPTKQKIINVPHKKIHLNIIKISDNNAYKDVEKRFKNSHDIDDALFLAKNYYRKKSYKKAIYWSLEVNKIDENIEESWLIFANSKIKTGHKNEAIRILTEYLKRANSYKAKNLLGKLKK